MAETDWRPRGGALGGLCGARQRLAGLPEPLGIDRSGAQIAEGEEIAAAGWASPDHRAGGQRTIHLARLSCITDDHGQIKSHAW